MSWDEQRRAPPILVDAFLAIRDAEVLAAQARAEEERQRWNPNGHVLSPKR